jgi:type II secretory pathway component PulM
MSTPSSRNLFLPLRDIRDRATQRWSALSPAGRRTITICAALLAVGLSWALMYEPLQSSVTKNRLRIQSLRVQAAQMHEQAVAVQSILTMAPVAASATQSIADVTGLQGVFGPKAIVTIALNPMPSTPAGVATFKVAVDQVPYAELIDRLEQATGRYRIRVLSMTLARAAAAPPSATTSTLVSGELLLVDST